RYQVDAASKLLGGLYYTYAVRGDGQKITEMIPPQEQRKALSALLATLQPEALAIPQKILNMIPPRAFGYGRSRETFKIRTGLTFDALAAAETAANLTVSFILHPARASRLVEYHARNYKFPGLNEVIDKLLMSTWKAAHGSGYHAEIQRVVDNVILQNLLSLAANEEAATQVRAVTSLKLDELKTWLTEQLNKVKDERQRAHNYFAVLQIGRFQDHPEEMNLTKPVEPPAGQPIGMDAFDRNQLQCGWE
ncbi:MAG: zinc-dependent metalloprotease, partial [bacterium]